LISAASEHPNVALEQLVTSLRLCSPVGLAETKKLTTRAILQGFDAQETSVTALSERLFSAEEAQEGIAAFKEGRPPRWAE
jgi:enoyl-CoA hydratase